MIDRRARERARAGDVNPIAVVLTQLRHAVIDPDAPTAVDGHRRLVELLVPLAIVAAVFVVGFWVFARETPGSRRTSDLARASTPPRATETEALRRARRRPRA